MTPHALLITPESYPPALDVLGVQITLLADRAHTGSYEITLQQGAEGIGPPPHRHAWDESFFVLDGEVEISAGDRTALGRAGALVHVPAGLVHAYRFGKGGGRMLELSQGPRAAGGAAQMFANVARDTAGPALAMPALVRLLADNGVALADTP